MNPDLILHKQFELEEGVRGLRRNVEMGVFYIAIKVNELVIFSKESKKTKQTNVVQEQSCEEHRW